MLLNESIENLNIKEDGVYVDCTLGGGGHSLEVLKRLSPEGRLIGIDQDENALKAAKGRLSEYENVTYVRSNFSNISQICDELGLVPGTVNAFMLDLGVSSHQLDEADRGFSYNFNAQLDMRMDDRCPLSAFEVVNEYSEKELARILYEYGEERWAKRIAEYIVKKRAEKPISTTFELVDVIKAAVPKGAREGGPHPARRTFQAIRIEVNNELSILKPTIEKMADLLKTGGRICIITFHSLEDRIVKNAFRDLEDPCICPRDFPVCVCGRKQKLKVITRKPIVPSDEELSVNKRSRSAKLRVAEKV